MLAATLSSGNAGQLDTFAWTAIGSVAGIVGFAATFLFGVIPLYRDARSRSKASSQQTLEERLDELSESMKNSARLVEQVSAELDARAATARKLQQEATAAQALAEIHKEQAEAIRRLLDVELEHSERRIRRDSIFIGIGSFIAGGGVSFIVTLFVHPLY